MSKNILEGFFFRFFYDHHLCRKLLKTFDRKFNIDMARKGNSVDTIDNKVEVVHTNVDCEQIL